MPNHIVEHSYPITAGPTEPGRNAHRDCALSAPVALDAQAVLQAVAREQVQAHLQNLG
jgi:hypothetical protein